MYVHVPKIMSSRFGEASEIPAHMYILHEAMVTHIETYVLPARSKEQDNNGLVKDCVQFLRAPETLLIFRVFALMHGCLFSKLLNQLRHDRSQLDAGVTWRAALAAVQAALADHGKRVLQRVMGNKPVVDWACTFERESNFASPALRATALYIGQQALQCSAAVDDLATAKGCLAVLRRAEGKIEHYGHDFAEGGYLHPDTLSAEELALARNAPSSNVDNERQFAVADAHVNQSTDRTSTTALSTQVSAVVNDLGSKLRNMSAVQLGRELANANNKTKKHILQEHGKITKQQQVENKRQKQKDLTKDISDKQEAAGEAHSEKLKVRGGAATTAAAAPSGLLAAPCPSRPARRTPYCVLCFCGTCARRSKTPG